MAAMAAAFLLALWLTGFVFEAAGFSSLVGETLIGMAMGPGGADLIPMWKSFGLLGKIGIYWLLFDGGAHLEVEMIRETGLTACLIAFAGVLAPLLLVWGTMVLAGFTALQGFVMGTALAPTSGGMAVKLMRDAGVLQTKIGQTIVCAAMTDDILSLVILAIVSNLGDDGNRSLASTVSEVSLPVLSSVAFIFVAGASSKLIPGLFHGRPSILVGPAMAVWAALFILACQHCHSSSYMGAFLAGLSFSNVYVDPGESPNEVQELREESSMPERGCQESMLPDKGSACGTHLEKIPDWLEKRSSVILEGFFVSIFFASAGFGVPVAVLFDRKTCLLGLACSLAAMLGKLLSGLCSQRSRWCVGWAMVARGELGFVMAGQALARNLTTQEAFDVTVWAVVVNTLVAPPIFQRLLAQLPAGEDRELVDE